MLDGQWGESLFGEDLWGGPLRSFVIPDGAIVIISRPRRDPLIGKGFDHTLVSQAAADIILISERRENVLISRDRIVLVGSGL